MCALLVAYAGFAPAIATHISHGSWWAFAWSHDARTAVPPASGVRTVGAHAVLALCWLAVGCVQILAGAAAARRASFRRAHKAAGRVVAVIGLVTATSGVVAQFTVYPRLSSPRAGLVDELATALAAPGHTVLLKNLNTSVVGLVIVLLLCGGLHAARARDFVVHKEMMLDAFLWSAANGAYRALAALLMRAPRVEHARCAAVVHSDAGMFGFILCAKCAVCGYSRRLGCAQNRVHIAALVVAVVYIEACGYQY